MTRVAHERRQRRRCWWWARSEVFIDDAASFNYATLTLMEVFHQNSWSLYITIWPILMQNFQTLFVFELKYSPGETHSMLKADCPKLFSTVLFNFLVCNKIINIFVRVKMNRIAPQNVFFRGNSCQHQQQEEQLLQTSSATPANH